MGDLAQVLQGTLSPDAATRRAATAYLDGAGKQPGFAIALLRLAENSATDLTTRQAAATLFKNFVKRNWREDEAEDAPIPEPDRGTIKANLVNLMSSVPPLVQRQLSEALSFVSKTDFPDAWPSLLPELVSKLGSGDMAVINGVLETAASVFARFTEAADTDANRRVLLVALAGFAGPLTDLFSSVDKRLGDALAGGQALATHRPALAPLFACLKLACGIFHALNWIDLPEFFEENIARWMGFFHKYLSMNDPRVKSGDDDVDEGPLEGVQAAVLDCIALYADKYDEEFEPFFATFVSDTWALLSSASATRIAAPHLDPLVTKAMKFLVSAVSQPARARLFADPATLRAILEKVVVPNILLRDTDEELFDDNALEFIRRDIEGSDSDTRRRVASDLVRGLVRAFGEPVTRTCLEFVTRQLGEYQADAATAYVSKDAAVALFCAVAVKSSTQAAGVTAVNELVSVGDFLRAHVLPELQTAATAGSGSGSASKALEERPIVKAAALKFVATFRNQLSRDELAALLPAVVPWLGAPSYVVHTYAAAAVERMVTVKDRPAGAPGAPGADAAPQPRLGVDALSTQLIPIFSALFGRMTAVGYPENDYMMKCLLRVVVAGRERIAPFAPQLIGGLTTLLGRVCANPSNPAYNHFLFEAIAAVMRSVCGPRPEAVAEFEAMLFPPFQSVLVNDVMEFLPYVFQLLAELLDLRPPPPPGESALTDGYKSLLPPLLTAALWSRKGNVPALTQLACAYLRRGAVYVVSSGQLLPLLGVAQKLLSSKNQEEHAFDILRALVEGAPWPVVAPHFPTLLQLLLMKLQESKAARIARQFVHWVGVTVGTHGAGVLEAGLNGLSPGLYAQILESVVVPMANRVTGAAPRKETVVGLTRILTDSPTGPALATDASKAPLWARLLATAVEVVEPQPHDLAVAGAGGGGAAAARFAAAAPAAAVGGHGAAAGGIAAAAAANGPAAGGAPDAAAGGFISEEAELDAAVEAVGGGGGGGGGGEGSEYTAAYSRLVFAQPPRDRYAFAGAAPDVRRFLATRLGGLGASMPGRLPPLVAGTPVAATVAAYCAAAGVTIQ